MQEHDLLDEISTHDLVQPLTAIKLQAQLAARRLRDDDAAVADVLSALDAIADRAGALADNLAMQLLAGDHDASSLRVGACDVVAIVRSVVAALDAADSARVLVIAPPSVIGGWDGARLAQVAWNLISNALKYSAPDDTVRVSVEECLAGVRIYVDDDGIGLAPDEIDRVFTRGYRSPRVVSSGIPGVGLGLSGCRAIVEAHGGTIAAESDGEGLGARFTITLPRSLP